MRGRNSASWNSGEKYVECERAKRERGKRESVWGKRAMMKMMKGDETLRAGRSAELSA